MHIKHKTLGILITAFLLAIPLLGFFVGVDAQSVKSGNRVSVASNEVVDTSLYVSGRDIDIAGKVNGDIICAGQNVSISAEVEGDIICAAQTIDITGDINGSIRVVGQTVSVDGAISDGVSVVAQTFNTRSSSSIGRDLGVAAQTAVLNGSVERDIAAQAGSLTVNSSVGRNVDAETEQLNLGEKAAVSGDVSYTSSNQLTKNSGAVINGKTIYHNTGTGNNSPDPTNGALFNFAGLGIYLVLAMLVVSLVIALIMPASFQQASDFAFKDWTKTLALGVVSTIIAPLLILGLLFTLVGIPLAILFGLVWLIVLFLSGPFAAYLIGRLAFKRFTNNAILIMLGGSLVVLVLYLIPVVNLITMLAALWFGVGMILQQFHPPKPRYTFATDRAGADKKSTAKAKSK